MELPPVRNADKLGRGVFSSRHAKRARNGTIVPEVFTERKDAESLSVDRLDHASDEEMAEIGDRIAEGREGNRSFYGWAVVSVEAASKDGRKVQASPRLYNPYHADIYLNIPESNERKLLQVEHAHSLAVESEWRARPA